MIGMPDPCRRSSEGVSTGMPRPSSRIRTSIASRVTKMHTPSGPGSAVVGVHHDVVASFADCRLEVVEQLRVERQQLCQARRTCPRTSVRVSGLDCSWSLTVGELTLTSRYLLSGRAAHPVASYPSVQRGKRQPDDRRRRKAVTGRASRLLKCDTPGGEQASKLTRADSIASISTRWARVDRLLSAGKPPNRRRQRQQAPWPKIRIAGRRT